jgi:hypothetical protein
VSDDCCRGRVRAAPGLKSRVEGSVPRLNWRFTDGQLQPLRRGHGPLPDLGAVSLIQPHRIAGPDAEGLEEGRILPDDLEAR